MTSGDLVLDMDLDFFQSGRMVSPQTDDRPPDGDYVPWSPECLREFLETSCRIETGAPIPGALCLTHDGVFRHWALRLKQVSLHLPLRVVHVDAHADLGVGNDRERKILTHLMRLDSARRASASEALLNEGNYLLLALACGWVGELTYVYHPEVALIDGVPDDVRTVLFRDRNRRSGRIELPCIALEDEYAEALEGRAAPVSRDAPVVFDALPAPAWRAPGRFDFAYLAISPRYTSVATEKLLSVFSEYISFDCMKSAGSSEDDAMLVGCCPASRLGTVRRG